MNLNAYDTIPETVDKTKTWLDVKWKRLMSREIKYRPYVTFCKQYVPDYNSCDYFVVLLDDPPADRKYTRVSIDDYGRVKINLMSVWNTIPYLSDATKNVNINITRTEHTDDGDIYYLDI